MTEQFRGVEDIVESGMIFAYTDLLRDLWQMQGNTDKEEFDQFLKHVLVKTHKEINVSIKYVKELLHVMDIDNVMMMKKNILGMVALKYPDFIEKLIDIEAMDKILPKLSPAKEAQMRRLAQQMTDELVRKTRWEDEE